jgi:hypothetical protein
MEVTDCGSACRMRKKSPIDGRMVSATSALRRRGTWARAARCLIERCVGKVSNSQPSDNEKPRPWKTGAVRMESGIFRPNSAYVQPQNSLAAVVAPPR